MNEYFLYHGQPIKRVNSNTPQIMFPDGSWNKLSDPGTFFDAQPVSQGEFEKATIAWVNDNA